MDVLAIVGSAPHHGKPAFECPRGLAIAEQQIEFVLTTMTPEMVISGGADGVDNIAEQVALTHRIPFRAIKPRGYYPRWDSVGGFQERNIEIARRCTRLLRIACAHSSSYGSGWTADFTEDELHKPVQRLWIDRDGQVHDTDPKKPKTRRPRRPAPAEQLALDVPAAVPDDCGDPVWVVSNRWRKGGSG